jgi:hypothetical protein
MLRRPAILACARAAILALAPATAAGQPPKRFYVSLGDSYASGWQPTGVGQGRNTRNGFAYIHLRTDGYRLIADLVANRLPRRR